MFLLVKTRNWKLSVDLLGKGFNSFFKNEIHEEDQEQDHNDQQNQCPILYSHKCSFSWKRLRLEI